MRLMWSGAKGFALVVCMLFLVQCGDQTITPATGEKPQAPRPEPQATTWVSCLPPQWDPPAMPGSLCPSTAPGRYMLTITARELIPKIEEAIVVNNDEGQVTNIVLTFEQDAFVIQGTLTGTLRTTIQVSGRLVVRNGRIEADMVKGKFGVFPMPAAYMAEATKDANKVLDTFFRTEYGIRVTSVEIVPGELRLTGERLP